MAQVHLCSEGKEGAAILFSFLAAGLLTPMQRGPAQGISNGWRGGGASITVSQGRPSPLVEAALYALMGDKCGQWHRGSGSHSFLFWKGGLCLGWSSGEQSMSQRCSCELMIRFVMYVVLWKWLVELTRIFCLTPPMTLSSICLPDGRWHRDSSETHPCGVFTPKVLETSSCHAIWAFSSV